MSDQTSKKGNNSKVVVVLLLVAVLGLGFMFIQKNNESNKLAEQKAVLENDKKELEISLEDKIAQFDKLIPKQCSMVGCALLVDLI